MQIGMVGLGRMGANLIRRLHAHGHTTVAYDINPEAVEAMAAEGSVGAQDLDAFVAALETPRVAWIMVPAALAGDTVSELAARMEPGDIIIDGGNSKWRDDVDRAEELGPLGLHYVDVGTSGGVFGLERGFCLMVGGETETVALLTPIFDALAPGIEAAERTPDRAGDPGPGEAGWLHCGPAGAGHFVKMVHNGIEYGMMAAIAEGLAVMDAADAGTEARAQDAETTPLGDDAKYYRYDIDTAAVAEVWRRGSVISSWLIDLTAHALFVDPQLEHFEGRVSDSGEGRWTAQAAIDVGVPAHVITGSLYQRFASRGRSDFADKSLSAMRREFGGHHEKPS
ncbi:MAG: decarboxylating 6-phosphogluconate dehydrogenase [Acidimicrobiales bacterium]|nr:decarboxylating 6-phosphogluconate dehydrogenase [Acidimicrobiales bacterium]